MTPHSSFPVFSEGCVSSAPSALRVPRGDPTCSPLPRSSSSTTSSRLLHPECQPGSSLLQEVLGPGRVGPRCPHLSPVCPGVFGSSLLSISEKQQSSQNPGVLGALGFIPDVSLMSCVTWLIPSPPGSQQRRTGRGWHWAPSAVCRVVRGVHLPLLPRSIRHVGPRSRASSLPYLEGFQQAMDTRPLVPGLQVLRVGWSGECGDALLWSSVVSQAWQPQVDTLKGPVHTTFPWVVGDGSRSPVGVPGLCGVGGIVPRSLRGKCLRCSHQAYTELGIWGGSSVSTGGSFKLNGLSQPADRFLLLLFNWKIVALQCPVSFRCTEQWFRYTCSLWIAFLCPLQDSVALRFDNGFFFFPCR